MRKSRDAIGEGREDVNTIADALGQISMAVSEAAARAEEIFHGADSHALSAERMVTATEELKKGAEGSAAKVDEVALTAREQLEAVSRVVDGSENLVALAEQLRALLRGYRTKDTTLPSVGLARPAELEAET
jgi:methyl-accepting chemotaxis protein